MRRSMTRLLISSLCFLALAAPLQAQATRPPQSTPLRNADTYLDAGAADLVARARAFRDAADSSILSYTGTVRSRIAAGLRMPLKDRTLYRRETASRIRWSRNAPPIVKALAFREQTSGGISAPGMGNTSTLDEVFDPTQDRIYFGLTDKDNGDDDVWIEHPLVDGAEQHYRYQSGDTLTVTLQGGRKVRAIELRVMPRRGSGHLVNGSVWIEPTSGTVVQAVYRLARPLDIETEVLDEDDRKDFKKVPGMFRPVVFDISLVVVEYALFDLKYWMPRVTRLEGYLRAGVFRAPASYEIKYEIDEVITATPAAIAAEGAIVDSVTNAWQGADHYMGVKKANGVSVRVIMPFDSMGLMSSPELPEPIWKKNADFITDKELDGFAERLAKLSDAIPGAPARPSFTWGAGASDLLRYNRVEALSVGARAEYELPRISFAATARIGLGDLHPNAVLSARHVSTKHSMTLRVKHALTEMDTQTDPFGMGNSMSALLLGRDDGEYYRASGAALTFAPSETERPHYDVTFFAQHDDPVERETSISLRRIWQSDFKFRDNVAAARTELAGVSVGLRPWWGSDPFAVQGGLDVLLEGATGGFEFARTRVIARSAIPIGSLYRIGLEAGAGSAIGDVPPQRLWYIGGANTLRGYDGSSAMGTSFGRARLDIARTYGWGGLTVFSDAGWAGDRKLYSSEDILYSVGIGSSLLDGLIRVDLARSLKRKKQFRLELYVDALL